MRNLNFKTLSSYIIVAFPVFIFFYLFFYYTVNAPINDDYDVLKYLNDHLGTTSYSQKIKLLFSQANEHRIVYDRVWILIWFKLTGTINFNVLAFIGNLSLVGIAMLMYKEFSSYNKPIILFFPVTVLLFNLAFWENMTFAMATLSNFTVYLFAIASLYLLTREDLSYKDFGIACLCCFAAIFTQGGGIVLIPLGILILLYKKEYKKLGIYILIMIGVILIYFNNYIKGPGDTSFMTLLYDYKARILIFISAFLGNAFNFFMIHSGQQNESLMFSSLIGFALIILFLYITIKQYYKRNLFNYSLMLMVIFIACITAVSRASLGLENAAASRYRLNGVIFVIALYFWVIEVHPVSKKNIISILSIASVYFFAININHYEYLDFRKRLTLKGILFYNGGNAAFLNGDPSRTDFYKGILENASKHGIFEFPSNQLLESEFPYSVKLSGDIKSNSPLEFTQSINVIDEMNDSYIIEGMGFLGEIPANKHKIYIRLQNVSNGETVYFSSKHVARYDLNPYFNRFNIKNGGYVARIRKSDIKPGENNVSVMIMVGDQVKTASTDKKIIK